MNVSVVVGKRAGYDFTMTSTPVSIAAGTTGTAIVTVAPGAGLPDVINLSVSQVPPGMAARFFDTVVPEGTTKNAQLLITVPANATPATYTLLATGSDAEGLTKTIPVTLTVTTPASLIVNGGFETGSAAPWVFTTQSGTAAIQLLPTSSGNPPHLGNYSALLEGGSAAGVDTMTQQVTITRGSKATLGLWYEIYTGQTGNTAVDTMTIQLTDTSGNVLTTLATLSNLNPTNYYWTYAGYDVSAYMGRTVMVKITASQAGATYTDFILDDISLVVN